MRNLAMTLLLLAGASMSATAQVFIQNTMYNFNRFVYNPAAAGMGQIGMQPGMNLTLLGRMQWLGIDGAPNLSTLAFDSPAEALGGGVGAYLIADRLGPWTTTGINAAYAYHLPLGNNTLSIGVNGGLLQKSISADWQYFGDDDPLAPRGGYAQSAIVPGLGAGIYFTGPENKYYVGISGQDLLEPSLDDLLIGAANTSVERSFYLSAGYNFELSNQSSLEPQIFARTDGSFPPQVDFSLYWRYKPVVFGASYRFFNDSFSGILGFNVLDRTFIAYSYDHTLNSLNALGDISSHEIILSFTFPTGSGDNGKILDIIDNPDDL